MMIGSIGRRGLGKTSLGVHMLEEHVERRALLDPRQMIRRPGVVVVRAARRLREAFDALAAGDVDELVYSPTENHADAFDAFTAELRRWVIEYPDVELGVLIDEASFYPQLDPRTPPAAREDFMFVVKSCAGDRFHLVLTCHRPTELPVDVRALMNRLCLFRTTQEHDLDVIRKHCAAAVVEEVQQLDRHEFVKWDDDDSTYEVNRLHAFWKTELHPAGAERSILELQ